MKKLIIFITIISIMALTFAGCVAKIDVDSTVKKLERRGLTVSQKIESDEELAEMTAVFNTEIALMGGDFKVEVKKYVALIEGDDYGKNCQIVTFATSEQAESYASLSIEYYKAQFGENNEWKVALSDGTVVTSNIKKVFRVVKADFN